MFDIFLVLRAIVTDHTNHMERSVHETLEISFDGEIPSQYFRSLESLFSQRLEEPICPR